MATQAQQVFYLNDLSRGKNWKNHRNIFDLVEHEVGETVVDDVFQEDDSREMPRFHPIENAVEISSLVRGDIDHIDIYPDMMTTSRIEELSHNDEEMVDTDESCDGEGVFGSSASI